MVTDKILVETGFRFLTEAGDFMIVNYSVPALGDTPEERKTRVLTDNSVVVLGRDSSEISVSE